MSKASELKYHLDKVIDLSPSVLKDVETLTDEVSKLKKRNEALEKIIQSLPHCQDITKLANLLERGLPLFSRNDITEIQLGLQQYAVNCRDKFNPIIEELEKLTKKKLEPANKSTPQHPMEEATS